MRGPRLAATLGGEEAAFLAGLGSLAVVGVPDWPLVLVLGVGRVLSHQHRWEALPAALEHA